MSLESIRELMHAAERGRYAVGYFESWNLESLQGVLDAAEETRSPMILGFNGDFLSRSERQTKERLPLYAAVGRAAAESASVPCAFIFNECPEDACVKQAIELGFNLVMPADPSASYDEYVRRVSKLTTIAHKKGVAVEAELGELPCGASGKVKSKGTMTDPDRAAAFVKQTRVDLLAVSVGNVHIKLNGEQALDLERLGEIRKRVSIPLVLHGGTGIAADSLREAIQMGVTKVNYGTYLKQRYLKAVRESLGVRSTDFSRNAKDLPPEGGTTNPHMLLGMGGKEDVMVAGRLAVRDAVRERLPFLGCEGRA